MTGSTNNIIKQLFHAGSLETVSVQQLEELVEGYPGFSAGHYLLSRKLVQDGAPSFTRQTQKTALYFSNPFWLHWLLKNVKDDHGPIPEVPTQHEPDSELEKVPEIAEPLPDIPQTVSAIKEPEQDEISAQISRSVMQQAEDAGKEIKPETPAFEPYHTIDYFASQGIRFVNEVNPDDKLGRQLKSFTEWLKMMKKLPRQAAEQSAPDETAQANIVINAAESIQDKEVVTEAMAEVLVKQGKTEKAADVYRKLSLLNPDKSVYFAARIEQLKAH